MRGLRQRLGQSWKEFRKSPPGRRFQDRYHRRRSQKQDSPWYVRFLEPLAAIVLLLIGVVLVFLPGPAILFFFVGAGLLASRALWLARWLDWAEVRCRKLYGSACRWWQEAPTAARGGVLTAALLVVGGAGYLAYRIMFAG